MSRQSSQAGVYGQYGVGRGATPPSNYGRGERGATPPSQYGMTRPSQRPPSPPMNAPAPPAGPPPGNPIYGRYVENLFISLKKNLNVQENLFDITFCLLKAQIINE